MPSPSVCLKTQPLNSTQVRKGPPSEENPLTQVRRPEFPERGNTVYNRLCKTFGNVGFLREEVVCFSLGKKGERSLAGTCSPEELCNAFGDVGILCGEVVFQSEKEELLL